VGRVAGRSAPGRTNSDEAKAMTAARPNIQIARKP
jgi:hypothetical protein